MRLLALRLPRFCAGRIWEGLSCSVKAKLGCEGASRERGRIIRPRESGGGGPPAADEVSEGWWRGRLTRRVTVVAEKSTRFAPHPPHFVIADASRRRSLREVRRPKAACAPLPVFTGRDVARRRNVAMSKRQEKLSPHEHQLRHDAA